MRSTIVIIALTLISCSSQEKLVGNPNSKNIGLSGCSTLIKPEIINSSELSPYAIYPAELRRDGIEGEVNLTVLVDSTGGVHSIEVMSSPHYKLTKITMDVVKKAKYKPAYCDDNRVKMWTSFNLNYKIDR